MGDGAIPTDFDGNYCCYSVQWPSSREWLAVLRGVLTLPADGRFWDEATGSILDAQAQIRPTFDINLANEECIMSCSDAIAAAFENIALAISGLTTTGGGSGCCGPSAGGGTMFPPGPGGVDTGGSDPATDPPPDGYDSWEQFETQRCGVATQILDDLEASLGNLTLIGITGLSVEGIVELMIVVLTLTVSTAGLAAIAALFITVGGTIICATALSVVTENKAKLVCALLSGTSSATSRAAFLAKFSELVDDAAIDPIEGFAIKQLIAYLIGNEETNRMYTPNSAIDYSGYSCPGCETCCYTWSTPEDAEGWVACQGFGAFEFPVTGIAVQSSGDGGELLLTAEESDGSFFVGACVSDLTCPLTVDSVLCRNIDTNTNSASWNNYVYIQTDAGFFSISAETSNPIGVNTFDLSAHDGEILLQILFGFSCGITGQLGIVKAGICDTCVDG